MKKKILLTAFEPFGGDAENASALVCAAVPETGEHYEAVKRILPTEFRAGAEELLRAMDEAEPELVVCLGQAGGRRVVTPERIAVNCMDARIPDNAGFQPDEEPIRPDGETAYFSNAPVKAAVQAAQAAGLPAALSDSAGVFVCNCVFYTLMNRIACTPCSEAVPAVWGDFIHVPYVAGQQGAQENLSLPPEQAAATVTFFLEYFAKQKEERDRA